MVLWNRW